MRLIDLQGTPFAYICFEIDREKTLLARNTHPDRHISQAPLPVVKMAQSQPQVLRLGSVGKFHSVPGQWPRRLLHIPTMTSLERQPGNIYGDEREPAYSILTYTWGRWRRSDGPRLAVAGVTWPIPAIDEQAAFTVASFRRVIEKMGATTQFAWIDIACIDQADYAVKMDEIGRQVGIFANAAHVYAWLWRRPSAALQEALDEVVRCSIYLTPVSLDHVLDCDVLELLKRLGESIREVLDDWWFSSLWTLQESILRRDAVILGQEGEPLKYDESEKFTHMLNRFIYSSLWHIHYQLTFVNNTTVDRFQEPPVRAVADVICQQIEEAGYSISPFATNPNLQYAAAATRNTSHSLDRIYGILSIYNLHVGATVPGADASRVYSFEELEDEFAATLNAFSPLLAQLFVHTKEPRKDRSWQITQKIRIPHCLTFYDEKDTTFEDCEITATPRGCAQIKGKVCGLAEVLSAWRSMRLKGRASFHFNIIIDDYICKEHERLPYFGNEDKPQQDQNTENSMVTATVLLQEYTPEGLSVYLLGCRDVQKIAPTFVGLLLLHGVADRRRCQRLGICVWDRKKDSDWERLGVCQPQWIPFHGELY